MADAPHDIGGRELRYGRYDLKIEALRRAEAPTVNPDGLYRAEFDAMRELDVSTFVLTDFLKPLGLSRQDYRGFSQVDRVTQGDALATSLARLAAQLSDGSHADDAPATLLAMDAIARGLKVDAQTAKSAAAAVLLGNARAHFAAGRLDSAYEDLSKAIGGNAHQREVNALLGRYFQRRGDMAAAAAAYQASLLNLGPASGLNRPFGLAMDYKGYRILQVGSRFCAVPRWRDARVQLVDGKPTVIAHRLPRGLRRWLLRHAPRVAIDWARRHVLPHFLTAKLDRRAIEADDLMAIMRRIDVTS